jgi:hypothetical protein
MSSSDAGWYHTIGVLVFVGCWKHAWSVPGAVVLVSDRLHLHTASHCSHLTEYSRWIGPRAYCRPGVAYRHNRHWILGIVLPIPSPRPTHRRTISQTARSRSSCFSARNDPFADICITNYGAHYARTALCQSSRPTHRRPTTKRSASRMAPPTRHEGNGHRPLVRDECRLRRSRRQLAYILVDHRCRFRQLVLRHRLCRQYSLSTRTSQKRRWFRRRKDARRELDFTTSGSSLDCQTGLFDWIDIITSHHQASLRTPYPAYYGVGGWKGETCKPGSGESED